MLARHISAMPIDRRRAAGAAPGPSSAARTNAGKARGVKRHHARATAKFRAVPNKGFVFAREINAVLRGH
jgi:hypothetical protein